MDIKQRILELYQHCVESSLDVSLNLWTNRGEEFFSSSKTQSNSQVQSRWTEKRLKSPTQRRDQRRRRQERAKLSSGLPGVGSMKAGISGAAGAGSPEAGSPGAGSPGAGSPRAGSYGATELVYPRSGSYGAAGAGFIRAFSTGAGSTKASGVGSYKDGSSGAIRPSSPKSGSSEATTASSSGANRADPSGADRAGSSSVTETSTPRAAVGAGSLSAETSATKAKRPHVSIFQKKKEKPGHLHPPPISQVDGGEHKPEQLSELFSKYESDPSLNLNLNRAPNLTTHHQY